MEIDITPEINNNENPGNIQVSILNTFLITKFRRQIKINK